MLTTTLRLLKSKDACSDRYAHLLAALGGASADSDAPITLEFILDHNGLDDALWALRATIEDCSAFARTLACDFAARVLPIYEQQYPGDLRPRQCIDTARRYAHGTATRDEMDAAARDAAWAARDAAWAARDAARDARDAAWDAWDAARAARDAARAARAAARAARAAARDARDAWDAAWDAWDAARAARAARDAERTQQIILFRRALRSVGSDQNHGAATAATCDAFSPGRTQDSTGSSSARAENGSERRQRPGCRTKRSPA
jgi:hypothetical protein